MTMHRDAQPSAVGRQLARSAGAAAVLGGVGWLLLIPAAELQRRGVVSYDGYNRLLAVPLVLFTFALAQAAVLHRTHGRPARAGLSIAAVGTAVLAIGNVVEFYGVLVQDGLNAYAASQAGVDEHWIGSDIGWIVFGIGMLVLLVGGVVTAIGLGRGEPRWLRLFTASLGVGVLVGNLLGLAPAFLSVPALGLYAAGWLAFGRHLAGRARTPSALRRAGRAT